MRNRYLSYIKNILIAGGVAVASGVGVSELTSKFTDNGKIIGVAATIAQYIGSWAVFLPLQARDNKEVYIRNGRFDYRAFLYDNAKLAASFILLDIVYLVGRPLLQDYFIDGGMSPGKSSITTDAIGLTGFAFASVGLARLTGVIKGKGDLEKIVDKNEPPRKLAQ